MRNGLVENTAAGQLVCLLGADIYLVSSEQQPRRGGGGAVIDKIRHMHKWHSCRDQMNGDLILVCTECGAGLNWTSERAAYEAGLTDKKSRGIRKLWKT